MSQVLITSWHTAMQESVMLNREETSSFLLSSTIIAMVLALLHKFSYNILAFRKYDIQERKSVKQHYRQTSFRWKGYLLSPSPLTGRIGTVSFETTSSGASSGLGAQRKDGASCS